MPVIVPSTLLSVAELAAFLHVSGFSAKDTEAANRAVAHAVALVTSRLGFDITAADVDGVPIEPVDLMVCAGVAVRVAAQWFTNPQDRGSYSGPEGLSFTGSPMVVGKTLTEADRVELETVALKYAPGFG